MKLYQSFTAIVLGSVLYSLGVQAAKPADIEAESANIEANRPNRVERVLEKNTLEPFELLQRMQSARKLLSYQLAFIDVSSQGIESLRYRHAVIDGQTFAQLLQIDGPKREVLQRGKTISYYDQSADIAPFSLPGDDIIDGLPSIFYTDFTRLKNYYHFIALGRGRVTDRQCDIVRIVSVDGTRYSYVVWLDQENSLPLQVALLSPDGDTIEQFRVIDIRLGEEVTQMFQPMRNRGLPPIFSALPQAHRVELNWKPEWLPDGMRLISQTRRQVLGLNHDAESQFYSDGLYDFTINVTDKDNGSRSKSFSNGQRTLVMEVKNKKEISVVGMIPLATAKRILNSIKLGPTS